MEKINKSDITVSFLITEEDFISMQLSRNKYIIPKENKMIFRITGIISILIGSAAFINIRENIYQIICWFLLIAMGCYVMSYYDVINPYLIKKDSSEFYKRNKKEISSKTVILTENEFSVRDNKHHLKIPLIYICAIAESKTTVLVYTDIEQFCFIPKRVLNENQIKKIRSLFVDEKYKSI